MFRHVDLWQHGGSVAFSGFHVNAAKHLDRFRSNIVDSLRVTLGSLNSPPI